MPLSAKNRAAFRPSKVIGSFATANTTFVPQEGDAKIAEVLFYEHALSTTELAQVERALGKRYGITVK